MEHLQGETLAERILRGPLPLASALEIAVQIAEGLDAAHKRGIVHRDLKPANVMLTKTGATLLDFGLAKLRGHGESPALTLVGNAPTESASITREGAILGTLQYMAPEQIQGKEADAHADLWALGAMLYEMVSGKRPFTGGNPASLMGAILERDPPSLSTALPVSPPSLDRLIRRCLAKTPDERWESARDLADQLRWIAQDVERGEPQAAQATARPLWRRALPVAAGAVAGLLAGAAVLSLLYRTEKPAPRPWVRALLDVKPAAEVRSAVGSSTYTRTPGGSRAAFAWTPDGRALVFAGQEGDAQQLFVRPLDGTGARPLPGTAGAQVPVLSADGKWVAFWADGAIRKIPLGGGPASVMADSVAFPPAGMDWGATGLLVYDLPRRGGWTVWQVRAGSKPEAVTTLGEGELMHLMPHLLPGDKEILFTVRRRFMTSGGEEVVAQVLASGERKALLPNATDARYLPPGRLLFMREGTLFGAPFNPGRREVAGQPVALLEGISHALTSTTDWDVTSAGQIAVSSVGDLACIPSPPVSWPQSRLVTVDRTGGVEALPAPARGYGALDVSPDGSQLAVSIYSPTEVGIWIYDLTRQTLTRLTPPEGESYFPRWSPDGKRIVFDSLESGIRTLRWQRSDGSAPPELLAEEAAYPSSWSPDGRELAVVDDSPAISALDLTVQPPLLRPLAATPNPGWPAFSPDGHWLAFAGGPLSEMWQVYLQPYPGPGPRLQVSVENGLSPAWNPNGKEIFFLQFPDEWRARMMSVSVTLGAAATLDRPRQLFEFNTDQLDMVSLPSNSFAVAPDGRRFFSLQPVNTDPPPPVTQIHLIQNWVAELRPR